MLLFHAKSCSQPLDLVCCPQDRRAQVLTRGRRPAGPGQVAALAMAALDLVVLCLRKRRPQRQVQPVLWGLRGLRQQPQRLAWRIHTRVDVRPT